MLKTYVGFRDHWQPVKYGYTLATVKEETIRQIQRATSDAIEKRFKPRRMVLSRTKSTFAFTQNIRFGERHRTAPTFLGLKIKKEKFDVVSVDSFCDPKNQGFLAWDDFKVFRENHSKDKGWFIEDKGKDFVKRNRYTNKPNSVKEI